MNKIFAGGVGVVMAAALLLAGCGGAGSRVITLSPQLAKAEKIATAAIKEVPGFKPQRITVAKLLADPFQDKKLLSWPAKIIVVSYAGHFTIPQTCPTTTPCNPETYSSATVVINPSTEVVLQISEPALSRSLIDPGLAPKPNKVSPKATPSGRAKALATPRVS